MQGGFYNQANLRNTAITYNPIVGASNNIYFEGGDRRIKSLRPAQKNIVRPSLTNKIKQKGLRL
jgi:hypothetical protein